MTRIRITDLGFPADEPRLHVGQVLDVELVWRGADLGHNAYPLHPGLADVALVEALGDRWELADRRQDREHPVPCSVCRRSTWRLDAICHDHEGDRCA